MGVVAFGCQARYNELMELAKSKSSTAIPKKKNEDNSDVLGILFSFSLYLLNRAKGRMDRRARQETFYAI